MHLTTAPHPGRYLVVCLCALAWTACGDSGPSGPHVWVPGSGYLGIPLKASIATPPAEEKLLPGVLSTDPTDALEDPNGGINPEDTLGDLAIAALWGETDYFTDGDHNDNDWPVTLSKTVGMKGKYDVYTLSPPQRRGTGLRMHGVFFRFETPGEWRVWEYEGGEFTLRGKIAGEDVNVGGWTRVQFIDPNTLEGPLTVVFAPADAEVSMVHTLGPDVQGARVGETPFGTLIELRYALPGTPFDTVKDYADGPGSWANLYGQNRKTYPVRHGGQVGVVWQDQQDGQPWVTWYSDVDPSTLRTAALPPVAELPEKTEPLCSDTCWGGAPDWIDDGFCDDGGPGSDYDGCGLGTDCTDCGPRFEGAAFEILAAATSDDLGNLYVLHIQVGGGAPFDVREAWLIKSDPDGQELARRQLDTSADGLNMVTFGGHPRADNHGTLKWSAGRLGLMLTRTMTQSGDGLNHQGGIALVFDDQTLERVAHHGQTSGHSFSNFLTVDSQGRFLGIDLGDNYPRGVHLHRFDESGIASRVVYTFKTAHGTSPQNAAGDEFPLYEEISDGEATFYQWSNDNATYTEIGGVVETEAGLAVLMATERSELDNGRATGVLNDPRDLAMVVVRPDFENATTDGWNVITDDLVVSEGEPATTGGFFGFNGGWYAQRNAGVIWRTDYPDVSENVSRLKVHPLGGHIFALWERWSADAYGETVAMQLTPTGGVVVPATAVDAAVRLGFREDLFALGDGVATIAGQRAAQRFVLHVFIPSVD